MSDLLRRLAEAACNDSKNEIVPLLAKLDISTLSSPEAIEILIGLFSSGHWLLRNKAAFRLTEVGTAAVAALKRAAVSGNPDAEFWAMSCLGDIGDPSALDLIRPMLVKDPPGPNADFAALAMAKLGDMTGVKHLFKRLTSANFSERERAAGCLQKVAPKIIKALVSSMGYGHEEIRFWCLEILRNTRIEAVDILIKFLVNTNVHIRRGLAEVLGDYPEIEVVDALSARFADPDWHVRALSSESLRKIGQKAVQSLLIMTGSENEDESYWSIRTLGNIGGREAVDHLLTLLSNPSPVIRMHAARYLSPTKPVEAIEPLVCCLGDPSLSVRRAAAEALTDFGEDYVDQLAAHLDSENEDIGFWLTRTFGHIKGASTKYLLQAMQSDKPTKRKWAAVALGMVGDISVCNVLVQGFKDEYWPVRQKCSDSLAMYGVRALEVLIQNIQNEEPDICFWTTKVLQKIKDEIWDKLVFYLSMGNEETRFFTAFAFGEIGDPRAVDTLMKALEDGSEWVRKLAMESLVKLGCIEQMQERMQTASPALKAEIGKKLRELGVLSIDVFIQDLASRKEEARNVAVRAIMEMGKPAIGNLRAFMDCCEEENLRLSIIKLIRAIESGSEFEFGF